MPTHPYNKFGWPIILLTLVALFFFLKTMVSEADKKKIEELTKEHAPKYRLFLHRWGGAGVRVGIGCEADMDEIVEIAKEYWFVGDHIRKDSGRHRGLSVFDSNNRYLYEVQARTSLSQPRIVVLIYSFFMGVYPTSVVVAKTLLINNSHGKQPDSGTRE